MNKLFFFLPLLPLLVACGLYEPREVNTSAFSNGDGGKGPVLAVIGDSQSTGVIASTTMKRQPPPQLISSLLPFFYSNNPSLENLQEHFSEFRQSAVTTDEDWGLRATIAEPLQLTARDIPLYLAAQWGGKLRDLPNLLTKLERSYAEQGVQPAYAVIMLGANDLCSGLSASQFEHEFASGIEQVAEVHPQAKLLVATIPPVPQLLRYTHNYNEVITCQQVRERFCPAIFASDFYTTYLAFNAAIERVVKAQQFYRNRNVLLVDGFRSLYFRETLLAFDCFHPNSAAQHLYAGYFAKALHPAGQEH